MIAADSNLIAYLHLPGLKADLADAVLEKEQEWRVPPLTISTFHHAVGFWASRSTIKIHQTNPEERHDGFVEFQVDGYASRGDFSTWKETKWTWQNSSD